VSQHKYLNKTQEADCIPE